MTLVSSTFPILRVHMACQFLVALQRGGRHLPGGILREPLVEEFGDGTRVGFDECALVEFLQNAPEFILSITLPPKPALEDAFALPISVPTEIDPQAPRDGSRGSLRL